MSLLIAVAKSAGSEPSTMPPRILNLCRNIVELNDRILYAPLPGKLVQLLTYFNEIGLTYELHDDSAFP